MPRRSEPSKHGLASASTITVATAAGLCFGSLGSDTGGSIRFPSAANGVTGVKPTWGRVSLSGAVPFGPSFDVAGCFARDAATLERVGRVLLKRLARAKLPKRLLIASDAFAMIEREVAEALLPAVSRVGTLIGNVRCSGGF